MNGNNTYDVLCHLLNFDMFLQIFLGICLNRDMDLFYQCSDVVVCRSGGSTLAELSIFNKFSLLVPYPYAADGHQFDNAEFLQSSGGAKLIKNSEFNSYSFGKFLKKWLSDPEIYTEKGKKAGELAKPNAANDMLKIIDSNIS